MRNFFLFCLLLLFVTVLLVGGDYYNLPLWPVNLLNRTYLMELHCRIQNYDDSKMNQFLKTEGGITIDLLDSHHNRLRNIKNLEMKTDVHGVFKIHLPQGDYLARAEVMAYYEGQLYHFATGIPGIFSTLEHNKEDHTFELELQKLDQSNIDVLIARFDRFLFEGNLIAGKALLDGVFESNPDMTQTNNLEKITKKRERIETMIERTEQFSTLTEGQYVSKLLVLEEIEELFRTLLPDVTPSMYRFVYGEQTLFVLPRLNALRHSLSFIWSEYLTSMDKFMQIRNYQKVFYFWLKLINNPEFYIEDITLKNEPLESRLQKYIESLPKLKQRLINRLHRWFKTGKEHYEKNDLEQAFDYFMNCSKIKKEFAEELELEEDIQQEIDEYLQDIQHLKTAQRYYDLKDWKRVRELYALVQHESQWLRVKKSDLEYQK